jgi:hypothetical protein
MDEKQNLMYDPKTYKNLPHHTLGLQTSIPAAFMCGVEIIRPSFSDVCTRSIAIQVHRGAGLSDDFPRQGCLSVSDPCKLQMDAVHKKMVTLIEEKRPRSMQKRSIKAKLPLQRYYL